METVKGLPLRAAFAPNAQQTYIIQSPRSQSIGRPRSCPDAGDPQTADGNILPPLEKFDTVPRRRTADPDFSE